MPLYRCIVPKDSVPFEKRHEVARTFTDIHCGATGAPRSFVQVIFSDDGSEFAETHYIDGGNRAGRPEELKQKMLSDLKAAFSDITGVPVGQIGGRITEGRASWSLHGGRETPEPGEETAEWYAHAAD
jgi:phenylpyruvate tautomerase PptA (4-oxalocrotonate tautomerase family)